MPIRKPAADARYAAIAGPFPWSDVSSTPTTLAGYGITDAYTKTSERCVVLSPIAGSASIVTVGTLGALTVTGLTTTGGVVIPSAQLTITGGAGIALDHLATGRRWSRRSARTG